MMLCGALPFINQTVSVPVSFDGLLPEPLEPPHAAASSAIAAETTAFLKLM
jgi:hypothetical protein